MLPRPVKYIEQKPDLTFLCCNEYVPSHFDSLKRSSARERGEAEHHGREKMISYNLVPRALIPGFGGADLGRTTSKAKEKRSGDEVGYPISTSEMLVVTSAGRSSVHNYQLSQFSTPENTLTYHNTLRWSLQNVA